MILSEFNSDCGLCVSKMFGFGFQEKLVPYSKRPTPIPITISRLQKRGLKGRLLLLFFKFADAPLNVRHGKKRGSDGITLGWQEESSISFYSSQLLWHPQYHQYSTSRCQQPPGQSYPCPCEVCTSSSKFPAYQK